MRRNFQSTLFFAATFTARQSGGVTYYNCGDWVESCSALVERQDGTIEMINYHPSCSGRTALKRVTELLPEEKRVLARAD